MSRTLRALCALAITAATLGAVASGEYSWDKPGMAVIQGEPSWGAAPPSGAVTLGEPSWGGAPPAVAGESSGSVTSFNGTEA